MTKMMGDLRFPDWQLLAMSCALCFSCCLAGFSVEVLSTVPYSLLLTRRPLESRRTFRADLRQASLLRSTMAHITCLPRRFRLVLPRGATSSCTGTLQTAFQTGRWCKRSSTSTRLAACGTTLCRPCLFNNVTNQWELFFMWQAQPRQTWNANSRL